MNSTFFIFVAIFTIAVVVADPAQDLQKKVNDKVDEFLARYTERVNKESPYNISRTESFYKNDNLLYGYQIVNDTKIFGLGDLRRDGNVSATKTGQNIWRLSGYLNLTAPLIEGSLYMIKGSTHHPKVKYVSSPPSDLVFSFTVVINVQWKRLLIESLTYRYRFPQFPITLDCPLYLNKECNWAQPGVAEINAKAAGEIILFVQSLLTLTPLSPTW